MTPERQSGEFIDEPTWFGEHESPLFGWVTRPTTSDRLGGVVIVPSVGYEARSAKRALRELARQLARAGFVVLRFDLHGTGDSTKDFVDVLPNPDWIGDVARAVGYLRSIGLSSVSIVGMRLGATLAGEAVGNLGLDISSAVLWDPCETGRSYLRELRAFESLRRGQWTDGVEGAVETAEFLFPQSMATSLQSIKLSKLVTDDTARRTLVITRTTRLLSTSLHDLLASSGADFITTDEQEALLNLLPFYAALPLGTMAKIVSWLVEGATPETGEVTFVPVAETIVHGADGAIDILERATYLGDERLFAILSLPTEPAVGPWIIIIGNVHEDHTGQSRLWVELTRRWARSGLRCARVDLPGLGESDRLVPGPPPDQFDPRLTRDVVDVGRSLEPQDPSNTVYIGFCAATQMAMEGALALKSRGVCVINPPLSRNVTYAVGRLQRSKSRLARTFAENLERLFLVHGWTIITLWETLRGVLPGRLGHDILRDIKSNGSDILILGSADDLRPHTNVPILRSLEVRSAAKVKNYPYVLVPDFDHDMTVASGRSKITALLDEHVRKSFATPLEP